MKAIIIGTPGKGKTTLCLRLREEFPNIRTISLGGLRSPLGIHEPHKGYETEVSPENEMFFRNIVDNAMCLDEDFIVEGYGLKPEDARYLSEVHSCPCILLCHKNTTALEDFKMERKYGNENKWSARRSDEYLKKLYEFYKSVELKWIERMPSELVFDTGSDFDGEMERAYEYLLGRNERIW